MFWLMAGGEDLAIAGGAIVLACLAGGVSAVGASATAEQFPGEGRLSGLALGVTVATAIFGGADALSGRAAGAPDRLAAVPGAMIAVVALAVLPVLVNMPETQPALARAHARRSGEDASMKDVS